MSDEQQTEEDRKSMLDAVIDAEDDAEAKREGRSSPSDAPGLDDVLKRHEELTAKWDDPSGFGERNPFEEAKRQAHEQIASAPHDVEPDSPPEEASPLQGQPGAVVVDVATPPPTPPPEQLPDEPWANLAHRLKQTQDATPSVDPLLEKMRAVGWAAPEKKPVDWAQLQANLQAAEHDSDTMRNIGASLHAAAPGFEPPHDAGAGQVAAAKAALEAPREQQSMEHAQLQAEHDKLQQAAASKAASKASSLDDHASAESAAAREKAKALYGDSGKLPPDFDRYSANQVEKLLTELQPIAAHQSAERIAKSKEQATADEKGAEAKAKEKATAEKAAATEAAHAADVESLGAAKQLWLKTSPYAKEHALTPADLADIKSRKDWEDFLHTAGAAKPKGKGGGAPPKAINTLQDIPDPGERALTQAVLENRTGLDGVDRKTKTRILEMAAQIDPKFDATRFKQYEKVVEKQAASDSKMSIDVALEHLHTARDAIPKNADAQFVNKAKQAVASGSGSAEFTPYVTASKIAAHELAGVYNIGDQAGKEMVEHTLEAAQSPEQLSAAFDTLIKLVGGKQKGFEKQLEHVAPKGSPAAAPPATDQSAEEKVINGKKYRKNARGKWETVDG